MQDPTKDRLERLLSALELSRDFLDELQCHLENQPITTTRLGLLFIGVERLEAHAKELQNVLDDWRPVRVAPLHGRESTL